MILEVDMNTINQIIQYFNFALIGIILLCGLIGFFRGSLKSGFYLVSTLLIFVLGFIFMGPIVDALLYMDVSFINNYVDGINIETPMQYVSQLILDNEPDLVFLLQEDTYSLTLMEGIVGLVLRIAYIIVLIVLSFTVFRLTNLIAWLIARKPLRRMLCKPSKFTKKGKPQYKKKIPSRLGGLGIGLTKGLLYTLLIGIIFAGVISVADSLKTIEGSQDNEVAVVCVEDTFTFVELSESTNDEVEDFEEESDDIFGILDEATYELIKGYRKTLPGKVFGSIKFGKDKTTLDEFMFDSIFKINGENGSIKLRKEIKQLAKALSNDAIKDIMSDGFDFKKLHELNENDLKALVDALSELDLIKVVVPVGLEFVTYSGVLEEMLGDSYDEFQKQLVEKLPDLLKIDYCKEVKSLGYVFIDVIDLLGEDIEDLSQLDFFNFDQTILNDIFEGLNNLELLEVVAPITISYLLSSDAVKGAIEESGFTLEDLGLTEDIDYVAELMNLPNIYEKVVEVGLQKVEGQIDFSNVDYTKVEGLVEALFTSVIIKNAVPVVATTLTKTYLPDEYKGFLPEESLKNVNWEKEFGPVLTAVTLLMKTGILNAEEPIQALLQLDDNTVSELGKYLAKSDLICDNMNSLLDTLLKSFDFEGVTFVGLDETQGEVWDEVEISSLFKAIKQLAVGLDRELTDLETENLAINLSSSKYIKKNLTNLVNSLTRDLGFELANLSVEEWNVNEIYTVFKSINIISSMSDGTNIKVENFLKLSDENLTIVLESKLIKDSLRRLIIEKSQPGGELQLLKGVYEDGIDSLGNELYSWDDETVEVASTITGSTLNIIANEDVQRYIVYKNDRFFATTIDELSINLNTEEYTYSTTDEFYVKGITKSGELRNAFNAIAALEINDISSFDIDLRKVVNKKDILFESYILSETVVYEIKKYDKDISANGVLSIPVKFKDGGDGIWHGESGELNHIIISLNALLDISNSETPVYITQLTDKIDNVYIEHIYEGLDEILMSEIITYTVIDEVKKLNGNGIYIPNEYMNEHNIWLNEYNSQNVLIKEGEVARFMSGVYTALNLSSETRTPVKAIDVNTINLDHIVNDHVIDDILYSDILDLTIKNKVLSFTEGSNPSLYIAAGYNNSNSKNYIVWSNTYNDQGEVIAHGELNYFFEALHYILNGDATLENLDSLSYSAIFETNKNSENVIPQDEVFKSKIISETILKKIVFENSENISIPSGYNLDNDNDRSAWFNVYDSNEKLSKRNELANLINSLGLMLNENQMHDLQNLDIMDIIDSVLPLFKDDEKLSVILKSYVSCETIKNKIITVKSFKDESTNKDYIKLGFENYGKSSSSSKEWYSMDSNGNPVQKELWNLLKGVSLLLGNQTLSDLNNISIELLINNSELIPTYDTNCNITSNEIEMMLKSMVLEEIFVNVSKKMVASDGYLGAVINVPSDVNWYKKDVSGTEEYDLLTFLQSFYLLQDLLDYQNNKNILETFSKISSLNDSEVDVLATAMVISRIFRGSIEKMMNTILGAKYILKTLTNSSMKPWDSVKFVQNDYVGNTKAQAKAKFIATYKNICAEINK